MHTYKYRSVYVFAEVSLLYQNIDDTCIENQFPQDNTKVTGETKPFSYFITFYSLS